MSDSSPLSPIVYEVIRNRLVAITDEMRVALQSVSGSPTVTEASDFFTGLFTPKGAVASMGFQVAYQAPVCGAFIRHIIDKKNMAVRDGDMFIGNDPYIAALHQNDVQIVGPIFVGDRIVAWAGVEAHETDVGGMDFASWSPKAREVFQEGSRIPCVKLIDRGELRHDVLEMIVTASRLPSQLGLDIRAFIATVNVARDRVTELAGRYGVDVVIDVMGRMIASSEAKMRARLRTLPDGEFHAADFLEHDGHTNELYKLDVRATKRGDRLILDFSGSSKQSPGFINSTRSGLMGGSHRQRHADPRL
ncbi:MAG TPA: hydantoinase B/oxoprolinase family protein [Bauldia sp.]